MPIKQTTPASDINDAIDRHIQDTINAVVYRLMEIGVKVINTARNVGGYKNQTGNLRSSTGWVVAVDGQPVKVSEFTSVLNGGQGSQEGRNYALSLVGNYPKGIVLIIVAGMQYAAYVAAKGLDVLDTAELDAKKLVPAMLRELGLLK